MILHRYTEALALLPEDNNTQQRPPFSAAELELRQTVWPALLANRSRSRCSAGRFDGALSDALLLLEKRPGWSKGHYRAAQALDGLERWVLWLQRGSEPHKTLP